MERWRGFLLSMQGPEAGRARGSDGAQGRDGPGAGRAGGGGEGGARGRCLTRSLALFTLMTLAASDSPVDFSVHLWTSPKRPLRTQGHSRLRAPEAQPDEAGFLVLPPLHTPRA